MLICAEYGLNILMPPTQEIRVFALELQSICAQYGLEN